MITVSRTLFFIITMLHCANAQEKATDANTKDVINRFDALAKEQRSQYISHKRKAFKAMRDEKYFSCMLAIHDAQSIFNEDTDLFLLLGLCQAQIHNVDKAIAQYKRILAINPTHWQALENLIEINFFSARHEDVIKYIVQAKKLIKKNDQLPLLDFKYLISLTKLTTKHPAKYQRARVEIKSKFTSKDDTPFYYYAQALEEFESGNKEGALNWIIKAHSIFRKHNILMTWNKALVDTGYIEAYEIIVSDHNRE